MCGIAGLCLSARERQVDTASLSRKLLTELQVRGRDAAGAAWTEDGKVWYDKAPGSPARYAQRCPITPLATNVLLHSRAATHGDPRDNRNNHPFALPGVTGVHNGVLRDWERHFKDVGAEAESECDSEAIFALLAHGTGRRVDRLAKVKGDGAIAWIETDRPNTLWLARLVGRPLFVAETVAGSILFASTREILFRATSGSGIKVRGAWEMPEDMMYRIESGVIAERVPIPAVRRPAFSGTQRSWWNDYSTPSYRGSYVDPGTSKALQGTGGLKMRPTTPPAPSVPETKPEALIPGSWESEDEALWSAVEDEAYKSGFLDELDDAAFDLWLEMDGHDARAVLLEWTASRSRGEDVSPATIVCARAFDAAEVLP